MLQSNYTAVEDNITFSADTNGLTDEEINETGIIAEDFFDTANDPERLEPSNETGAWIMQKGMDYFDVLKHHDEVIGFTFTMHCTKVQEEEFISKTITGKELFEQVNKQENPRISESIYLSAFFIKKKYKGKGLTITAFLKTLNKVTENLKYKPSLFAWTYTKEV